MANPRQRRKARSGVSKVKQSRRQQDKLKKIIVQGPPALVKQWDVKLTARQNYERLGLALKRPLALRQSGGVVQKDPEPFAASLESDDSESESDSDADADSAHDDDDQVGGVASTSKLDDAVPVAADAPKSAKRKGKGKAVDDTPTFVSSDIPAGFARIERDADGNVLRVVMSAHDVQPDARQPQAGQSSSGEQEQEGEWGGIVEDSASSTPWGAPLNATDAEEAGRAPQPVTASSAAIRDLEDQAKAQADNKKPRFASPAEAAYLSRLVKKHGSDIAAMTRDIKLNKDQRTAGQLKKAFERNGGIDKFIVA